jgi:adenosyl cobinamide kinase/adenosyl cobinamide phosphate guanylyltransferase
MSRLKAIDPKNAEPKKPKILIYGKPGVGKTWHSLDFPNVYYIDTEGGASRDEYTDKLKNSGGQYFGQEQGASSFLEVIEQVKALTTEKHNFKTLIIDSLSKIFNNELVKEMERLGDKDAFGASKKHPVKLTRILLNWIDKLDMNVILICQERAEWANEKQIGVTFDGWDKLAYELDLCLNIVKRGASRKAIITKSRIKNFPDNEQFDWSYLEFSNKYGKEIINQDSKAVVLASEEQLSEFESLRKVMNIPQETIDKWLEQAKVDLIEEMPTQFIAKIIDAIKAKLK